MYVCTKRFGHTRYGSRFLRDVSGYVQGITFKITVNLILIAVSTLKMDAVRSSEMSVPIFENILFHISEDRHLKFPSMKTTRIVERTYGPATHYRLRLRALI
jgi:hypothetical protein